MMAYQHHLKDPDFINIRLKRARTCNGCRALGHESGHWQSPVKCELGFPISDAIIHPNSSEYKPLSPCPKPTYHDEIDMVKRAQQRGELLPPDPQGKFRAGGA